MKKILTVLVLLLVLSSCGAKTNEVKKENLNSNLTGLSEQQLKSNIKKLDKEGKEIVIKYYSAKTEKEKSELKEEIKKHMLKIQGEISNIKGETIEEKNKEIQKITKKIKLYKSLGF